MPGTVSILESALYGVAPKSKTLVTYAAGTTSNSAEKRIDGAQNIQFQLVVLTMTGAGQTQDIKIQHRLRSTDSWMDTGLAFTQVVVAGGATWNQRLATTGPLLPRIRVVNTSGGTVTTFTGVVSMVYFQGARGRFVNHGVLT